MHTNAAQELHRALSLLFSDCMLPPKFFSPSPFKGISQLRCSFWGLGCLASLALLLKAPLSRVSSEQDIELSPCLCQLACFICVCAVHCILPLVHLLFRFCKAISRSSAFWAWKDCLRHPFCLAEAPQGGDVGTLHAGLAGPRLTTSALQHRHEAPPQHGAMC